MADLITNPKDGSSLKLIPRGAFIMGSELFDERPRHEHDLPDYYLSVYPVTNAQYDLFIAKSGYEGSDEWREYAGPGKEQHPVVKVSWFDATAYCQWAGLRLPTEPEWEKGARGTDGREYPWGEEWDGSLCRNSVDDDEEQGVCDVELFEAGASPNGLLQMAGNVWEWCANVYREDLYQAFQQGQLNPPLEGEKGVLRGGGWEDVDEFFYRCATRLPNVRTLRHYQAGFRPARNV